ncbi:MAG: D-alanyl-D-alanine carboxypeptidase [Gammaproteobacteria bacterium]|nr:D-alanyl-D-alanine carboxypeptidase [Gammaproteobacteria bacterium]
MKRDGLFRNVLMMLLSFVYLTVYAEPAVTPPTNPTPLSIIPSAPTIDAKGYILMDANTGLVLAGKDIDTPMPPASLTKLMTLYQIASALKANRLHMGDPITISEKAWRTGGSKMFVKVGEQVPVNALIQGIAVVSGNDACVAIAEHIAGTEEAFAELMNHSAGLLGMKNTHYTDATGLPDPKHYTTPRDLGLLTKAIVNQFPEYYGWYSQKEFEYNGIKQPNRDILLWRDPSIEGMKTGHTDEAGYCLVSTATRNGMRLIAVVMGSTSTRSRADASLALLNYGFRFYESKKIFAANTAIKQPRVWFGKNKTVPVGVLKDVYLTLPTGQMNKMQAAITLNKSIRAPIIKGQPVGNISVKLNDKDYLSQPLVALEDDAKGGIFLRMKDQIGLLFSKLLHTANS